MSAAAMRCINIWDTDALHDDEALCKSYLPPLLDESRHVLHVLPEDVKQMMVGLNHEAGSVNYVAGICATLKETHPATPPPM